MFTGIVEELGRVLAARPEGGGCALRISGPRVSGDLAIGDSVCVNGACQTVTALDGAEFEVYAMGETLRATTLGALTGGAPVNLERALTPRSRLGGHFVTGHVDGTAHIAAIRSEPGWQVFRLELQPALAEQLVPKGSIAVDGISLTLGPELAANACEFYLIPHTLEHTTLGAARVGQRVNIETDLLGKYVLRFLGKGDGEGRLRELLASGGFLDGLRTPFGED